MTRRNALLTVGSLLFGLARSVGPAQAQSTPQTALQQVNDQQFRHTRIIGLSLGGYALANIVGSGLAASQTEGQSRYFHRMNVYWNLVNLGIAGAGLLGSKRPDGSEGLAETVRRHHQMKQFLLFNAGLDVAYMAGGAYLNERGASRPEQRDKLKGFGQSVMAQGGFLLAFDLVNYFIFKGRDKQIDGLLGRAKLAGTSGGVRLTF